MVLITNNIDHILIHKKNTLLYCSMSEYLFNNIISHYGTYNKEYTLTLLLSPILPPYWEIR